MKMKSAVQIDVTISPMGNIPSVRPGITNAAFTGVTAGGGAAVVVAGAEVAGAMLWSVKMPYVAAGSGEVILTINVLPLAVIPYRLIIGTSAACIVALS